VEALGLFGERHLRHVIEEYMRHYHHERSHQALGGKLVVNNQSVGNDNDTISPVGCRSRLGGLLNYYQREAA
jgi:hypothetical protein